MKKYNFLVLVCCSAFLSGCATTQFSRPADQELVLGISTRAGVEEMMGKPRSKHSMIVNKKSIDAISYSHSRISFGKNVPVKSQSFFFYEDTLVGHAYTSSWEDGSTDFDESKVEQIKINETHVDEVKDLLGRPTGEQIYPLAEKEGDRILIYLYYEISQKFASVDTNQKSLSVRYNESTGIVSKVSYSETKSEN